MNTYYRKAWNVSAYAYRAELLCPECTIAALPTGDGEKFDGWAVAEGVSMSAEDNLTELAAAFGIDYADGSSYDSDDFPKPVFSSDLGESESCGVCGVELW